MITVLLVDDHAVFREGLVCLLKCNHKYSVVGCAGNGKAGVDLATELRPNVVVMDIAMPNLNGIDATRQIMDVFPDTTIIGLSNYADKGVVTEFLRAGGKGFLSKQTIFEELIHAIEATLTNSIYVSSCASEALIPESSARWDPQEVVRYESLTDRERDVLKLLVEGLTVKQVATRLHINHKTCHTYRARVMEKLNIRSMACLIKYAIRHGLTAPS